jgi:cyclohexanecarboxylate-CoA ligase
MAMRGSHSLTSLDEALQPIDGVAQVAGGLRAAGIGADDVVSWQSPNRDEVAVAYRACWRVGATAAPLHHLMGAGDVARMRDALQPKLTIDLDALPRATPVVERWTDASVRGAVLFTSGSSGAPKGVIHTQASLAYKAVQMAGVHGLGPSDCVLMPAPCAHISGLLNGVTLPGVVPFKAVFMARWDPEVALDLIEHKHVTYMVGPPTFFLSMMQAPSFAPARVASMRLISSGGAGVSEQFVAEASEAFGARVKRTYGSTEAPSVITEGRPIGAIELRLAADNELLVRGPELFAGYLDGTPAFDAGGWFHTGDLASIDADGTVEITGRVKDVIIRGGENISVAEIEETLEAHPDVRLAVALGEPDALMGERVAVFVEAPPAFDLTACRAWFAERGVAKFKTPERVVAVERIPLLASGKADREELRSRLRAAPG